MATKKTDINTEISRCINQLLLKEPFYAHILAGTVREVTTNIPTAAVGFNNELILLMVNETFFLNELKTVSERVAVLKHETLHLVFRHLFRDKIKEDSELFNIAADLVVNQYIGAWKLPDNAVTLKAFPDLNLKPEQNITAKDIVKGTKMNIQYNNDGTMTDFDLSEPGITWLIYVILASPLSVQQIINQWNSYAKNNKTNNTSDQTSDFA